MKALDGIELKLRWFAFQAHARRGSEVRDCLDVSWLEGTFQCTISGLHVSKLKMHGIGAASLV